MPIDLGDAVVHIKGDMKSLMTTIKASRKKIGLAMAAVGAGIVAGLGKAVKSAATFEQAITNAASVTGKTGKEFEIARDKMEALAKTLGRTTVFSASEAANAMYDLASSGFDVAAMSAEDLRPILDLAAATQHDLAATTEVTTATLSGFGMENKELARIADVFTLAIGKSKANMDKFSVSMPIVSTTASQLNVSFEETVAVLSLLYDKGIDASTSATGFRNVMQDLHAQNPRIIKGFEAVGVSLEGIDFKTLGVSKTFKELAKRGLDADEALTIFGKKSGTVASVLVETAIAAAEFTDALDNAGGTSRVVADLQLNTLEGQMKLLKSAFESVVLAIGKVFIPILTDLAPKIADVFSKIAAWTEANPKLTATIVKLTGAIGVGLVAGGLILAFAKLGAAIAGVHASLVLLANHPIPALILLIVGSLYVAISRIIKRWDDFSWAVRDLGETIMNFIRHPLATLKEQWALAFGRSWFTDGLRKAQAAVMQYWTPMTNAVVKDAKRMQDALTGVQRAIYLGGVTERRGLSHLDLWGNYTPPAANGTHHLGGTTERRGLSNLDIAPITITGNTFNVRQESDIGAIGEALYNEIKTSAGGKGLQLGWA